MLLAMYGGGEAVPQESVDIHLAQILDGTAALFLIDAFSLDCFRHLRWAPRLRLYRRASDEFDETPTRVIAIARLIAILLRDDYDHAVFGQAASCKPHQTERDIVRQRRRMPRVEPKLYRR